MKWLRPEPPEKTGDEREPKPEPEPPIVTQGARSERQNRGERETWLRGRQRVDHAGRWVNVDDG